MEKSLHILVESEDLSPIFAPLKTTTRVKYTCFDVSQSLLVIGASSGGLYVFRREPCAFLQLIPSKEGAVTQLAISPDEKYIGFATIRGTVTLVERALATRTVATSFEHAHTQVTTLSWHNTQHELFIGDTEGRVSVLVARTVFQPQALTLMQLDSRIVQLDAAAGLMLVSTLTRCYVCDNERELYRQIGQKLRDGEFGACFVNTQDESVKETKSDSERTRRQYLAGNEGPLDCSHLTHIRIFCARPGSRLWEVSADGSVLQTHHFKQALTTSPTPILCTINSNNNKITEKATPEATVNFTRLYVVNNKFLVAYKHNALYIFDPAIGDLLLWTDDICDIISIKCTNEVIYVWSKSGQMRAISLLPLEKFLVRMYLWKKYQTVAQLCLEYNEYLLAHMHQISKLYLLQDLDIKLRESKTDCSHLCLALKPFLNQLRTSLQANQTRTAEKLKSGVYLITRLNGKNRSQSLSPERIILNNNKRLSTSSLPDLIQEEQQGLDMMKIGNVLKSKPNKENLFELFSEFGKEMNRTIDFSSLPQPELDTLTKYFQSLLKQYLMEFVNKFPTSPCTTTYPEYLISNYELSQLELDWKVSQVLKTFSQLINESTILDTLHENLPCHYLSLLQILSQFESASMNLSEQLSPPRTLNIIQFLLKIGQVEQCARHSNKINLEHIMYLILNCDNYILFLSYLTYVVKSKTTLPEMPAIVKKFLITCFEKVEQCPKCCCGFPLPGVSVTPRFAQLGRILLENTAKISMVDGVRLCSQLPILWPHLLRLRTSDNLLTLLPLILHLNATEEIERRITEWNVKLCAVCVRHLIGLHRGECLNCGGKIKVSIKPLSFTEIGLIFIKAIGADNTVKLFQQYHEDVILEANFHQAVVLATIMEKHSSGLRAGVADVLAGKRRGVSPAISPDDNHWGVKASLDLCCECNLPFNSSVLVSEVGIVVFKCKHIFHDVCIQNRLVCPICQIT